MVAVVHSDGGEVVGYAVLQREPSQNRLELVVALEKKVRGRGFASEVAQAMVGVACQLGEPQVVGRVDPTNQASARLVAGLGMRRIKDRVDPLTGMSEHIYTLSCETRERTRRA